MELQPLTRCSDALARLVMRDGYFVRFSQTGSGDPLQDEIAGLTEYVGEELVVDVRQT